MSRDARAQEMIDLGVSEGLFCTKLREPVPRFRAADCEKVIYQGGQREPTGAPSNNCFIVLGRDRHSSICSGLGGAGKPQCGMIDLVVGRASLNSADLIKKGGEAVGTEESVGPNFITDAARIYITQRASNIDEYFGIKNEKNPTIGQRGYGSAIAQKADNIRIIGRQSIRIFCGGAQSVEGFGKDGETNTSAQRLPKARIDIIASNEKHLQPAVLGDNLLDYLEKMEREMKGLRSALRASMENFIAINGVLTVLTQGASPFSSNLKVNIEKWVDQLLSDINSELRRMDALNSLDIIDGKSGIVSKSVFIT